MVYNEYIGSKILYCTRDTFSTQEFPKCMFRALSLLNKILLSLINSTICLLIFTIYNLFLTLT